jgi:hypothetical protein
MSTYTQILYQNKIVTFREELIALLKEHGVEFEEKYLE